MNIFKLFKKKISVEESVCQNIHKDTCQEGRLVEGTCANYRVYDELQEQQQQDEITDTCIHKSCNYYYPIGGYHNNCRPSDSSKSTDNQTHKE